MEYRPLEGFVLAITPFNFTSIAGEPAVRARAARQRGGVEAVADPAARRRTTSWPCLQAAGLPPGVINLVTGDGQAVSRVALSHPDLAGIHFTGSTGTFQHLWRTVGQNIERLPRLPAAGRRDRRQGLRDRAPLGRPRLHRYHARPRRLRVPGPEVLRRLARLPSRLAVGSRQGRAHRRHRSRSPTATCPRTCPCSAAR